MEEIHYLYRHIKIEKEKSSPFYIGIGTKNLRGRTKKSIYKRAFSRGKSQRSKRWINLVNIYDYRVEILLESESLEFIRNKEIEFIALYGREHLGTGTLVNFAAGGEYIYIPRKFSTCIPVFAYRAETGVYLGSFESISSAERNFNLTEGSIHDIFNPNNYTKTIKGLAFYKDFQGLNISPIIPYESFKRSVIVLDSNRNKIYEFDMLTSVSKFFGIRKSAVSQSCRRGSLYRGKYYFLYKDDFENGTIPEEKGKAKPFPLIAFNLSSGKQYRFLGNREAAKETGISFNTIRSACCNFSVGSKWVFRFEKDLVKNKDGLYSFD